MIRRLDKPALLLAALGLLLALPVLTYPLGRDQGMYANIAQAIRGGGLPFIDMWDIKPPAIYYIYAAQISVFGATPAALRALDLIFAPLTMTALYRLARAYGGLTAARWSMLLFPVFYFTETFASLTQSDSLVIMPMTWAVLCALRAAQSQPGTPRALFWSFACGSLSALVMWFKHYYALFALALAAAHVWTRWRRRTNQGKRAGWRPFCGEVLAFAAGGLLIGIPSLIYFAGTGILNEMLIIAQGTSQYNLDALRSIEAFWAQMENYVRFRWWHWGPLLALALSAPLLAVGQRKHGTASPAAGRAQPGADVRPTTVFPTALLVLWIAAGATFVVIQAKGFDTHWIPLLPPLVILAARAVDQWLTRLERLSRKRVARGFVVRAAATALLIGLFAAILAKDTWARALPYLMGQRSQRAYFNQFQAGDLNAGESLRMARWLQERTDTGDSVYIWGFRPEIAFMAGLRPATRFQAQFALVGERYPQAWKQENVDTLWAVLPEYVIVVRADYMPWVTGSDKDSNTILAEEYQALEDWLIYNYERGPELGNFLIWRRKL